jgi:uncharacterized protein (TIRG00374 family)
MDPVTPVATRRWQPSWWLTQLALGVLVGALALLWTVRGLDWPRVIATLVAADYLWVSASLVCSFAVALTKILRWRALYSASDVPVTFADLFSALMITQMTNLLIPVRVGELVRIGLMKQSGQPGATTLATIAVEKAVDLVATGLIAVAVVALALTPSWLRDWAGSILFLGVVFVAGLLAVWLLRNWIETAILCVLSFGGWVPEHWRMRVARIAHTTLQSFGALASWGAVVRIVFWTCLAWLFSLFSLLALCLAFNLSLPWTAAAVLMLSLTFSNVAPTPPALVGITQAIAIVVLGGYGTAQSTALGFGIVLNVIVVGPVILLGSLGLGQRAVSLLPLLRHLWKKTA